MKSTFAVLFFFAAFLFGVFAYANVTSAQTCPHPACGAPGLPCCYDRVIVDVLTACNLNGTAGTSGATCDPVYNLSQQISCNQGSCQSSPVCSSNDGCAITRNISNYIQTCNMPSSCSPATCCGAGVTSSTPTPGGGGPTNTPIPPTPTTPPGKSCNVSISPSTVTLAQGASTSYSATVSGVTGGSVDSVIFRTLDNSIGAVCAPGNEPCSSTTRTDTVALRESLSPPNYDRESPSTKITNYQFTSYPSLDARISSNL
jgi:hypothetical protein